MVKSGPTFRRPPEPVGTPSARSQHAAKRAHVHAAGPKHGLGRKPLGGSGRPWYVTPSASTVSTMHSSQSEHAQPRQRLLGARREVFGIRHEEAGGGIEDEDARFFGIDRAEFVFQRVAGDFPERPGQFHAGGAPAHNREGEPGAALLGIAHALGGFERVENLVPDGGGFFHALQAGGPLLPLVVAEIGTLGTGGHDERIVGKRSAIAEPDRAAPTGRCRQPLPAVRACSAGG